MHENMLASASQLSDSALLARVRALALSERDATVELVAHLAVLDRRRTHLGEGPGSVYKYCHEVLGYSEDAAWNRAATANAVRRYPEILDWLGDGSLNVTTVRMLRPVLTDENHAAVLGEARRRSKREVELIVRRLDPKADVPSTVRKVAAPAVVPCPSSPSQPTLPADSDPSPARPAPSVPVAPSAVPAARPVIAPLTPERYKLQFTVSKEIHDKLRHVQNLLCREIPSGDPAMIFERALDLLVREVEKKKLGATTKPRAPRATRPGARDVSRHVRRAVWKRDEGRCAFVGPRGRCGERRFLEWHHVQPVGHQGPATVENISLRCRAHNVYESDLVFGKFVVSREIASFRNGGSHTSRRTSGASLPDHARTPSAGDQGP